MPTESESIQTDVHKFIPFDFRERAKLIGDDNGCCSSCPGAGVMGRPKPNMFEA
jgi:hypothetical protein